MIPHLCAFLFPALRVAVVVLPAAALIGMVYFFLRDRRR